MQNTPSADCGHPNHGGGRGDPVSADETTAATPLDLVAFLAARLDEDEKVARWCASGFGARWHVVENGHDMIEDETGSEVVHYDGLRCLSDAEHIARHDPARVLAEVEAWRKIIAGLRDAEAVVAQIGPDLDTPGDTAEWFNYHAWHEMALALASVYANHPDYDETWRP